MFVSDSEIRFQCPVVGQGSSVDVSVEENGASTFQGQVAMQAAMPGLFSATNGGQGTVLIGATDELVTPSRPARKGEFVTIYASGLGEVMDDVPVGTAAPSDRLVLLKNKVRLVVGGMEVEPAFAGLAPGTAGLFQVNAQLPPNTPTGLALPLYVKVILPDGTTFASNTVSTAIDQ